MVEIESNVIKIKGMFDLTSDAMGKAADANQELESVAAELQSIAGQLET